MARWLQWFMQPGTSAPSPRRRALFILGLVVVVITGLCGRLFSIQVFAHDKYQAQRDKNSTRTIPLPGERGAILTRDGVALARSTFSGNTVVVNPRAVPAAQRQALAAKLASLLGRDEVFAKSLELELNRRADKFYYSVAREISDAQAEAIKAACKAGNLPGVELRSIETREYPQGVFAPHIVGFVGSDKTGQEGVERLLDGMLMPQPGRRVVTVDALGRAVPGVDDLIEPAIDGANVELTLDAAIQAIVEEELKACVEKWDPVSVAIVVMETHTGAILGMSNYPTFDPNNPGASPDGRRNIAITDAFEPGSMFKPLIVCGAYQYGLLSPDSVLPYTPELKVPGRRKLVSDGNHPIPANCLVLMGDNRWGAQVDVGLVKSSNTQMTRIGLLLGPERLRAHLDACAFGRRTGFDLGGPQFGESPGRLRPLNQWSVGSSIPSVCMGYEVQVTALQMVNSFNAIANGGKLMKPFVVRRVVAADGEVLYERMPEVLGDTGLSETVTRTQMNETLRRVVSAEGTAKGAAITEYQLAGKTGTAHKVKQGQYSPDKICSFVGYAPADNPCISVIVVVNEARAKVLNKWGYPILHFGGTVAAPTMSRITLRTLKYLGVAETAPVLPELGDGSVEANVKPAKD
ncbi:cell division protein FtsI (penicillin-binding protein 3) [Planctomycetaceae bacterium]|nr:cell division protein FtsI (penicillin-binding protein 3) [Planctomycetaceae bacterium]